MQKLHDRKNIGKILLDPSKEPAPKVTPDKMQNRTPPPTPINDYF